MSRKYFTELVDAHKDQYALVLNSTKDALKEQLMKDELTLRRTTVSSRLLYTASCAMSLITIGYRFFTPKAKQEYVESFLPNTLDSQSKINFRQLAQEALGNLRRALVGTHQKIADLNEKYKIDYGEIEPFLKTISQDNLAELLKSECGIKQVTVKSTAKPYTKNVSMDPGAVGLGLS